MINLFIKLPNEKFFVPLTGNNKQLYLNCLDIIYNKSKLGAYLKEDDAKDYINELLRKTPMVDDSSEMMSEAHDAAGIIRYLRQYGWILETEVGSNYEKIIKLSSQAIELIICFASIANSDKNTITATNDVINIYTMIVNPNKIQEYDTSPYEYVLKPVLNSIESLFKAIKHIEERVKNAALNVMVKDTIDNVLDFMCNGKEELFPDYFKLKNNGNIDAYISKIKEALMDWYESGKIEKATAEYMMLEKSGAIEASRAINEIIENINIFFSERYPAFMSQLDTKTEDYFNSILVRLHFLSAGSGERRIENVRNFLNHIKNNRDLVECEDLIVSTFKEFKYLSSDSAKKKMMNRKEETRQIASDLDFSEDEKEKIRQKLEFRINQKSLREKVESFIEKNISSDKSMLSPNDLPVESEEDAYLYSALFCVYSGSRKNQDYAIVKTDGVFENDYMICDNFELRKKV